MCPLFRSSSHATSFNELHKGCHYLSKHGTNSLRSLRIMELWMRSNKKAMVCRPKGREDVQARPSCVVVLRKGKKSPTTPKDRAHRTSLNQWIGRETCDDGVRRSRLLQERERGKERGREREKGAINPTNTRRDGLWLGLEQGFTGNLDQT